jgi:LacI family transcriptional regulator
MQEHADKLRGFEASLSGFGGGLRLGPVVEAHDEEDEAFRAATRVFRAHPELTAVYVSTVNSAPVLRAAEREGRLPGLAVVTTDLFGEIVDRMRAGSIVATVYQRPLTQGRTALLALYRYLLDGTAPPSRVHVVPHLVMRSNVGLLLERLPVELEGAGETLAMDVTASASLAQPALAATPREGFVAGRRTRGKRSSSSRSQDEP